MLSGGIQQVRVVLRALTLLQLDEGLSAPKVSRTVPFAAQATLAPGCCGLAPSSPAYDAVAKAAKCGATKPEDIS